MELLILFFFCYYEEMKCFLVKRKTTRNRKIQSNTRSKVKDANDNEMIAIITNGLMWVCLCVCSCECKCIFVDELNMKTFAFALNSFPRIKVEIDDFTAFIGKNWKSGWRARTIFRTELSGMPYGFQKDKRCEELPVSNLI